MSLETCYTDDLLLPDNYKAKILLIAMPGTGKSVWVSSVPNVYVAACETGHGNGQLSNSDKHIPFCSPSNYKEIEAFCSGDVGKDSTALAIDSLSAMAKTYIKDYALTFPRKQGQSLKRAAGVPEQDDYGVMGELTRRCLAKLIALPKHIIVTCTLKPPTEAEYENGVEVRPAMPGLPDLPGQMALGATAMFDIVLVMRTRPVLANPKDAKSRFNQRYIMTTQSDKWIAKSRLSKNGKDLLDPEEVFNKETGQGSFPDLLDKILKRGVHAA